MTRPTAEQRFERLQALVEGARRLPAAERTAFLARAAPEEATLRAEAQALLDEDSRSAATPFARATPPAPSESTAPPSPPPAPHAPPTDTVGDAAHEPDLVTRRLGDCTLRRRLGDGGMGIVYEAMQEPPGRIVAVKVLRSALAGEEGRLRFEHEARVLAHLRHAGIAQIYETGTYRDASGEDLPYFVMEHVPDARTLLEHASARRLGTRERLALFVRVCDAVHFGHTKGVIHRDLKPDNVLVDAEGAPKVIDFGIARSTVDVDGGHATPRTETGMLLGTLHYMSPEQVRGTRGDVDTRSDVYALGVILYELLTGRLPYALEGLGLVGIAEAITSKAPIPPQRFAPDMASDLGVILQKALSKEPEQRYASAAALGQDLQRYLDLLPIHARPPSLAYQVRLFARRHRGAFAAAVATFLALVAAVVVSTWFAAREAAERREAERQRERAERLLSQTRNLVPWLLREFSGELARLPGSVLPRSRLATRVGEHLDALAVSERDHPDVLEAAVEARGALGDLLGGAGDGSLGRRTEAVAQYTEALALLARRTAQGGDPLRTGMQQALLLLARASSHKELGAPAAAQADITAAQAVLTRAPLETAPEAARMRLLALTRQADIDWLTGRQEQALATYRDALVRWDAPELAGRADHREGRTLAHLALAQSLLELGRPAEAAPHLAAVDAEARALEALAAPDPQALHQLFFLHDNVGRGLLEAGQPAEATLRFEAALRAAERQRAHDPRNVEAQIHVHNAQMLLGRAAFDQGAWADAAAHYGRALAISATLSVGEPPASNLNWDRRLALTFSGQSMLALGDLVAAERLLLEALPLAEARERALPDSESLIGLRDVHGQLSNVSVRRFKRLLAALPLLDPLAHLLRPAGFSRAPSFLAGARDELARDALRTARARLAASRDALARCRSTPDWHDGYARDLERIEQGLATMDEVLATYR